MYAFEYQRANSVADAATALAKTGGKALAGLGFALRNVPARRAGRVAEQQALAIGDDDAAAGRLRPHRRLHSHAGGNAAVKAARPVLLGAAVALGAAGNEKRGEEGQDYGASHPPGPAGGLG